MLEIKNLKKSFGSRVILDNVNVTIKDQEVLSIVGPSGAGKTTLLRCITGLEQADSGEFTIDGKSFDPNATDTSESVIGVVFQDFNLFPHLSVMDNIILAPTMVLKQSKQVATADAKKLLDQLGLIGKGDLYPYQLSGGQKQRVAIARALVNDPQILLCDEATSALDPQTTADILKLLKRLNDELGITIVVVTHEMQVIEDLCEYVAVLDTGKIVEQGDVYSMFADPQQELTRKFISTTSKLNLPDEVLDSDLLHLVDNQLLIKITYVNTEAIEPLISHISRQFEVDANIIVGDIKILQQKPLGGLVIILDGTKANIEATVQYINDQNIRLEVLDHA